VFRSHPVLECAHSVAASLKDVADLDPAFMTTDDKAAALLELATVSAQLDALRLRLMAASGDVAERDAARDVASWLAHRTRADRREARAAQRLARSRAHCWHLLADGLTTGAVLTAQAVVIARALDDLPDDLDPDLVAKAEAHLVAEAANFGPHELRVLGHRILSVVAPEVGEEQDRRRLEAEEREARRTTTLTSRSNGDGTTTIRIKLPDAAAGRLLTYLHAYANPRRVDGAPTTGGDPAPFPVRLGHAFCSLLELLDPTQLPDHGGQATTVLVTLDLETLLTGVGSTTTNAGGAITAAEARRLACTAQLVPAVRGARSEILDLGRAQRLYSPAQRRALAHRDGGCRADGCDIPAAWTEAHHLDSWAGGGKTDLGNALLLCSHHHHRAHDDRYLHDRLPNGDLRFHRRR
jgi:hypothetical protein